MQIVRIMVAADSNFKVAHRPTGLTMFLILKGFMNSESIVKNYDRRLSAYNIQKKRQILSHYHVHVTDFDI